MYKNEAQAKQAHQEFMEEFIKLQKKYGVLMEYSLMIEHEGGYIQEDGITVEALRSRNWKAFKDWKKEQEQKRRRRPFTNRK